MQRCNEFQRYRRKAAHAACLSVDGIANSASYCRDLAGRGLGGSGGCRQRQFWPERAMQRVG